MNKPIRVSDPTKLICPHCGSDEVWLTESIRNTYRVFVDTGAFVEGCNANDSVTDESTIQCETCGKTIDIEVEWT